MSKLSEFQAKLKAPKGQFNAFGKYKYRSAEDIVEAVKPVINPEGYYLTITDDVVLIGTRYYIKATVTLTNGTEIFTTSAFAREEESKKGMDGSQVTGAASSYARKYALNGLFAIDDTKDADATNEHKDEQPKQFLKDVKAKIVMNPDIEKKVIAAMKDQKPCMIGSLTFKTNDAIINYVKQKYDIEENTMLNLTHLLEK
jgi:hypothetical protein